MDARTSLAMRGKPRQYPQEVKDQAIDLFYEALPQYKTKIATAKHVAHLLGIGCQETIQAWVKQADVDAGNTHGVSTQENEEIRRLKRENAELKRANGILKAASAFFAAELDRPLNK